MTQEQLVPIPGFEGLYSISNLGRVWSHERLDSMGRKGRTGCWLTSRPNNKGYLYVNLYRSSGRVTRTIHTLVAEAFVPNPQNLPEVNHEDGDKSNCLWTNLVWSTRLTNVQHALVTGLTPKRSSPYYGVSRTSDPRYHRRPWAVSLKVDGKKVYLGNFSDELEAARTYNSYVQGHALPNLLNENV